MCNQSPSFPPFLLLRRHFVRSLPSLVYCRAKTGYVVVVMLRTYVFVRLIDWDIYPTQLSTLFSKPFIFKPNLTFDLSSGRNVVSSFTKIRTICLTHTRHTFQDSDERG